MIKKRAMNEARWVSELTTMKRLETGYAGSQPKYPYWVKPCNYDKKDWDEMCVWMVKTFGNGDWMADGLWVGSDRKYWFRDESDRTFFILRWS
jgi:hypothetical protein